MDFTTEKLVLKEKYKFITEANEFRLALLINGFGIIDNISGTEIIPLICSFNLEKFEECEDHLKIDFRIYPQGLKTYKVEIYPNLRTYHYENGARDLGNFGDFFFAEEDVLKKKMRR